MIRASEVLFSRAPWIPLVLDAVQTQTIVVSDLQPARLQQLAAHSDAAIRARAASMQQGLSRPDRNKVLEEYRSSLQLEPDRARGKIVLKKTAPPATDSTAWGTIWDPVC